MSNDFNHYVYNPSGCMHNGEFSGKGVCDACKAMAMEWHKKILMKTSQADLLKVIADLESHIRDDISLLILMREIYDSNISNTGDS